MTQGWKKAVSVMLCAAMILSMSSVMISADELNQPTTGVEQTQPEKENTNETPEENKGNTDNNTTEGETPNTENEQTSEAVKNVIAQLEALPKLDDLTEETDTEKLKNDVESAKAAFDALTEEEKASISEELKGNLADLDIFVTNFIVNTPTAIPETENDKVVGDQDGIVTLAAEDAVCEMNGQTYTSLTDAVAALPTDGTEATIKLLDNVTGGVVFGFNNKSKKHNVILDMQGYTYEVQKPVGSTGTETNGMQLLAGSKVVIKDGTIKIGDEGKNKVYIMIKNYCDLTFENVTVDATNIQNGGHAVNNCGQLNFTKDCKVINVPERSYGVSTGNYPYDPGTKTTTIEGGTFDSVYVEGTPWEVDGIIYKGEPVQTIINGGTIGKVGIIYDNSNDKKSNVEITVSENASVNQWENLEASAGNQYYATLAEAIEKAQSGATVTMLKDCRANVTIPDGKEITLNLNGYTLNGGQESRKATITNNGTLTLTGNGTVKREDVGVPSYYVIDNQGTMTIESGTVTNNSGNGNGAGSSLIRNGGVSGKAPVLNITGGTLEQNNFIVVKNDDYGTLNISGGTINSANDQAVQNWNKANISGGTINGNVYSWAYPTSQADTDITGGTIHGNVASISYDGQSKADVELSGDIVVTGKVVSGTWSDGIVENPEKSDLIVKGGNYGHHVDDKYLDDSLKAELYSPNRNPDAPFSYYPTVEEAKDEAEGFGGTITDVETDKVVEVIPAPSKPDPKPEKPSKPSKPSNGGSSNSGSSNSGTTVDKEEEDYNEFWDKVIDRINKADEGDTVTVHAGNYDKMPNKVMKALEKNGVGLIIKYNGGEIEIPAGEAVNKSNKLFWSFKELGNYVFATEDNDEQNNDKQDNEQNNGSENNTQSNTQTEQKPFGTVETKPNPQTGSEDYVGLAAALAVTAGVAAIGLGKKKKDEE